MVQPTMIDQMSEYLRMRRRLGFQLKCEGSELGSFAIFADKRGHRSVTMTLALQWATLPVGASPAYHVRRLDMVRRFAAHRALYDPETEIPPKGILGLSYRRPVPHIYSPDELKSLLKETEKLGPRGSLRSCTYRTLFGLLIATGLRISEALALTREGVDLEAGVLKVEETKFRKVRLAPIHPSTARALCYYAQRRDAHLPSGAAKTFFLADKGASLKYRTVLATFDRIREVLGWNERASCPRIHDIRHTFAVRTLLAWYEEEGSIGNKVAVLSTYLGHAKVTHTYWYLSAIPELMAAASGRFEMRTRASSEGGDGV